MQQYAAPAANLTEQLLHIVAELARELHPHRGISPVTLDSRLDRDLGFDSLARMELLLRVQRGFGQSLPEALLASADTPRDLLDALSVLPSAEAARVAAPPAPAAEGAVTQPADAATLLDVLDWHVRLHPHRVHIVIAQADAGGVAEQTITHLELRDGAERYAGGLQAGGLQPGEAVAIMLPTGRDYFFAFFGILLAGGIPVPLYPPLRASQLEDHLRRQAGILSNCQATLLVTLPEAKAAARLLQARSPTLRKVVSAAELSLADRPLVHARPSAGELAFLQYTSGSTGNPKGVMLTHANLLANIRAMGRTVQASAADVFVSWLPLYHDMGLIGAWFGSLYYGMRLVVMSPLAFLSHPARWLWAIHRHGGTLSAAPNFAYELCARRIDDNQIEGLDLRSWRLAFNGAEAVSPDTIAAFAQRFGRYGFAPSAMTPVYGLAECCVGLAFPPPGRGPVVDSIDRDRLMQDGRAVPMPAEHPRALPVVACGLPMPEHAIRIVDETGREVADRVEGRLQFKGPSATAGYYRNPEANRELLRGDWLDSGDLAYVINGEIYVTGRAKDIIIRGGRHLHPQEIEEAVGAVEGVRRGCVAVFGAPDPRHGTERLIVLAETRVHDAQSLEGLRRRIGEAVVGLIGEPADEIVLGPPHAVPKTSSGKLRRQASRALYERGDIGRAPASPAWQALRFAGAAAVPLLRRSARTAAALLYAGYAWAVFGLVGALVLLCVLLLPGLPRRRRLAQAMARLLVRLTRTPLMVHDRQRLSVRTPCVVISNHASYADALVLLATLPAGFPYTFLAKRELGRRWPARIALQRTGALLVERIDIERSVHDAEVAESWLRRGNALLVFAEGTLQRTPGLQPFHLGGFLAAARARVPIVPIAIRGTRTVLRGDQWFPRHGPVTVTVGQPVESPPGSETDFAAALALRDAARQYILTNCGEPDLAD